MTRRSPTSINRKKFLAHMQKAGLSTAGVKVDANGVSFPSVSAPTVETVTWPRHHALELSRRFADRCRIDPTIAPAVAQIEVSSEMVMLQMRGEI